MTYKMTYILIVLCVVFSFPTKAQKNVINSGWQFTLDSTKTHWQTVNIPHTWNKEDAFDDKPGYYRGLGFYKKQLFISQEQKGKVHYLKFNAVNQKATVYVNGQEVGNHKGGYTAFNFNISKWLTYGAYNLIEVEVDNSHNENIPPLDADFTFYGGIYRDVELISLPEQHISLSDNASDGLYIDYPNISNEKATVEVTVLVDNFDAVNASNVLTLTISDSHGSILQTQSQTFKTGANSSKRIKIRFPEIDTPNLWSPEHPYLYHLNSYLMDKNGNIMDEKSSSVAFRWVSVDPNKGLLLNGKPYKMIGVNRHQDYEGYGNAVPLSLQEKDMHLIKDMGANVIRFGHYPHSKELYKLCDELGLLVWSEIPIVNKVTNSKDFFATCLRMQEEHIKQYYNFPSIVMFGYMNEIFLRLAFDKKLTEKEKSDSKIYTYELAKQLEDFTRKAAPSRLTVMALHGDEIYNETKIADLPMLVGWNLYFGWYTGQIPDFGLFLDDQHKRFPNRTIMVSEYGPGADAAISSQTPKKYDYTQEYQLLLHKSYYEQVMALDFVAGMTAWNFADFGSEFRGETIPHVNQKGLVQYNRVPKEVYYWYQSVLTKDPFVHIALNEHQPINLIGEERRSISVFSNQRSTDFFLNGEKLNTIQFENGLATIEVPFVNGINELKVVANSQKDIKTIQVFKTDNLRTSNLERFGINIGSHFNYYDKETNVMFVADRPYSEHLYGYLDGIPYNITKDHNQGIPQNIQNSQLEGLFQMMLEDCTTYKVDIPDGNYKITLYFVEPQLESEVESIYNLKTTKMTVDATPNQRIFDIILNEQIVESRFNMAKTYPDKYGITISTELNIKNNQGLSINLKPIEGKTVISGVLIKKI
ncbi:MAG: glycoside hydrolase family 2 TIM barrel-domain containing protein [Gelidibacter sp.]